MKKQTTKTLLAFSIAVMCAGTIRAQSIGPSILNSTGSSAVVGGNTYEWSIGEMMLVHTASATGIIVTQGLLQPAVGTTGIAAAVIPDMQLNVFPVPATTILNIQPAFPYGGQLRLSLLDITGRNIYSQDISLASGEEQQQLNIGAYAPGNYVLQVSYESKGSLLQRNYKIQKIQ